MRFRVFGTLAVLVAAVGLLAVGVSTAAAKSSGIVNPYYNYAADPQTTNVPWLAWAGETVKITRCFGLGDSQVTESGFAAFETSRGNSTPPSRRWVTDSLTIWREDSFLT